MWTVLMVLCFLWNGREPETNSTGKAQGNLIVQLSEVESTKGKILISLFNQPEGFPEEGSKAFKIWALDPAQTLHLGAIPPGEYALALLHDTDQNQKMTFNRVGFPKEGYSASPDGGSRWTKPNWNSSRFKHGANQTTLKLKMHY